MNVDAGSVAGFGALLMLLTAFAFVGWLLLFVVAALGAGLTPDRRRFLSGSLAAVVCTGGAGCVAFFKPDVLESLTRSRDLRALDEHSRPLIEALRAYRAEYGRSAAAIQQLVPRYLSEVPGTGLENWPEYEYSQSDPQGWHLAVWIPKGFFDLDGNRRFQYEPDPLRDREVDASIRHGDWVYIPD